MSQHQKNIPETALVTGAAGFIGSHLCEALLKRGLKVIGLDNLSTGCEANLKQIRDHSAFRLIRGDIADDVLIDELLSTCNSVYHLAASVGVKLLAENPLASIKNNLTGIQTVFELAARYQCKLFFASSSEVYGKADEGILGENDPISLGPPPVLRWSYGCGKAMGEYLAFSYHRQENLPVVIGRFFNICGPRQTGSYGMVIPSFVSAALKGDPIIVHGDGKQVRSFTFVGDAVRAVIDLMQTPSAEGEVFNIGNPRYISIAELAQKIKMTTNSNSPIVYQPYTEIYGPGFEDMLFRVPDISKLKSTIRFSPEVDLDDMLEQIIRHFQSNLDS